VSNFLGESVAASVSLSKLRSLSLSVADCRDFEPATHYLACQTSLKSLWNLHDPIPSISHMPTEASCEWCHQCIIHMLNPLLFPPLSILMTKHKGKITGKQFLTWPCASRVPWSCLLKWKLFTPCPEEGILFPSKSLWKEFTLWYHWACDVWGLNSWEALETSFPLFFYCPRCKALALFLMDSNFNHIPLSIVLPVLLFLLSCEIFKSFHSVCLLMWLLL
jgi:hypothetical protein